MGNNRELSRLEPGSEPQTLEELRSLEARMPPARAWPRLERTEDRSGVDLPFQIAWKTSDGRQHVTTAQARDIAASSVYFELEPDARLSSPDLLLKLEAGQELSLYAVARVVRVEAKGGKIGIAVVVEDYRAMR